MVLLLLEVPLGLLEMHQERDALAAGARREATALSVLAADELEHPGRRDLSEVAARYRAQAGSEVAVVNRAGEVLVSFDPDEQLDENGELVPLMRRSLAGQGTTVRRTDEGRSQLVAVLPVHAVDGEVVGAVAVAVSASATDRRILRAWLALALFAAVLLAIVAGLGILLAHSLTAPLTKLQRTAQKLGHGDLATRASPEGPRELHDLATEFNAMADRLAAIVGGQQRFLADASHQLRTPLTSLRLRLDNLADANGSLEAATGVAQSIRSANAEITGCQAEVTRLTRLVDGLLAISRAVGRVPEMVPSDVTKVVGERTAAWSALAEERSVSVELRGIAGADSSMAMVDPHHLEQILDNLLANALEASPVGSVIEVEIASEGGQVVIQLTDSGPGMNERERARAFDRFWQGSNGANGSSGLGLAIVADLAAKNGAMVALDSVPSGHGLKVTVVLSTA